MRFLVEPPTTIRPGALLNPPVVVRLDKTPANGMAIGDPSRLWAFISITDEAGAVSLAPPNTDLVAGNLSDSVHTLETGPGPEAEEDVGFVSFPDLAINYPGRYRLRVSLMKLDAGAGAHGAQNLQTIESQVIRVETTATDIILGSHLSKSCCI